MQHPFELLQVLRLPLQHLMLGSNALTDCRKGSYVQVTHGCCECACPGTAFLMHGQGKGAIADAHTPDVGVMGLLPEEGSLLQYDTADSNSHMVTHVLHM